jgi:carbonic anhydrase
VQRKHEQHLAEIRDEAEVFRRLCELNVIEQVANVCQTSVALDAWERGQELSIHGWIYGLNNGLLRDLNVTITANDDVAGIYESAVRRPHKS